jgi:cardiolipin synthase
MGLANWLTLLRIVLIPVVVSLLVYRRPGPALLVFCIAAVTDVLDGYVARTRGLQSRLGGFLDPMADKLLLTACFMTLTYLKAVPFWITAVVITRDVMQVVGALLIQMVGARIEPRPTWAGKMATFFQVLTVLSGLLTLAFRWRFAFDPVLWLAAGFTIVSFVQYIALGMHFLNTANADEREESHESTFLR